jgi:hypothetical protein
LDLDELDLIKDPNTVAVEEKARGEAQAKEEAFMKELAILKATSGGHMNQNPNASTRPQMERLSPEELEGGAIPEVSSG